MSNIKSIFLSILPFLLKLVIGSTVILIFIAIFAGIISFFATPIPQGVHVVHLNEKYKKLTQALQDSVSEKSSLKKDTKDKKTNLIYVLSFTGDIAGSEVEFLREEITTILQSDTLPKEIILRLESGGGFVHTYGLAASELERIKQAKIPLTITVDKVAASGGYMMACVADTLVSAPFAIVGSIGVVAEFPNFSGWMEKNGITYEQHTAGEYKRTISPFTKTTEKSKLKTEQDLARVHQLFKNLVSKHRPSLDIARVSTGEIWYGDEALQLKLVDKVLTSDELIIGKMKNAELYEVTYVPESTLSERISATTASTFEKLFLKASQSYVNNW